MCTCSERRQRWIYPKPKVFSYEKQLNLKFWSDNQPRRYFFKYYVLTFYGSYLHNRKKRIKTLIPSMIAFHITSWFDCLSISLSPGWKFLRCCCSLTDQLSMYVLGFRIRWRACKPALTARMEVLNLEEGIRLRFAGWTYGLLHHLSCSW